MMDLQNIDLLSLQTSYMKQDATIQALCAALTPQFQEIANDINDCFLLPNVDALAEAVLDELAWQMHIDWYDSTVDIAVKRQLIKDSIRIHRYRGTPYAVEELIKTFFGDGYVQEWFEYGGEPGMFKVITSNASVTSDLAVQFIKVLDSVKRKSAHLEEIIISLSGEMELYFAGIVHTGDNLEIRQVV